MVYVFTRVQSLYIYIYIYIRIYIYVHMYIYIYISVYLHQPYSNTSLLMAVNIQFDSSIKYIV